MSILKQNKKSHIIVSFQKQFLVTENLDMFANIGGFLGQSYFLLYIQRRHRSVYIEAGRWIWTDTIKEVPQPKRTRKMHNNTNPSRGTVLPSQHGKGNKFDTF